MSYKLLNSIFFFLGLFVLLSCRKMPGEKTYINLNECSNGAIVYVCFDSLITDSRCPRNTDCVWSGNALIKVTFLEDGMSHKFIMSLRGYPSFNFPSDTLINGYHIIFDALLPYPGDGNNYLPRASLIIK